MSRHSPWLSGCLLLLAPSALFSADIDAAALSKVVSESAAAYSKALAGEDAKAVGALFTPEGEYVDDDGVIFHGRAAIEAEFAAVLKVRPKGKVDVEITSVRPIATGLLAEEGVSTFTPEKDGPVTQTRFSAIHQKQTDGKWLIASVRELEFDAQSAHERLKSLAFLLGNWREETDGNVVDTEWKWSEDGNFLISQFASKHSDGEELRGTHRIGWDGERKQFRSWVFLSDSGFAEGWWTSAADRWSVQLNGVNSSGDRMSAVVSYDRDGKDAMVISQDQRSAGGVALPSYSNRVVRQPPAPAKRAAAK